MLDLDSTTAQPRLHAASTRMNTIGSFSTSRGAQIPPEKLDVPHDPPERVPFDLDLAAFLANFAFETYRVRTALPTYEYVLFEA